MLRHLLLALICGAGVPGLVVGCTLVRIEIGDAVVGPPVAGGAESDRSTDAMGDRAGERHVIAARSRG